LFELVGVKDLLDKFDGDGVLGDELFHFGGVSAVLLRNLFYWVCQVVL